MPVLQKQPETEQFQIGNQTITVNVVPLEDVQAANLRIQKQIDPVIRNLRKIRKKAAITASQIILNA